MNIKRVVVTALTAILLVGASLTAACKPDKVYAKPANLALTLEDRVASGDHVGTISWTAVSDNMGAPTGFIVNVVLRVGTAASITLAGYPKTVSATTLTDTFRYVPSPLTFGQYQYTVEVRQVRRGLTSAPASAVGTIQRDDAPPPAPGNVTVNVVVEP